MSEAQKYSAENPLDLEGAHKAVHEVVAEFGADYEYQNTGSCFYVPVGDPNFPPVSDVVSPTCGCHGCKGVRDGSSWTNAQLRSGCLVGEALKRVGLLTPELASYGNSISAFAEEKGLPTVTGHALNYLQSIQLKQDSGEAWGQCVERADGLYGLTASH